MNLAALVIGGSVASVGVGSYMLNNSSKKDDTLGGLLMVGGAIGAFGGAFKGSEKILNAAKAAGTAARFPYAPVAAAAAGVTAMGIGGKQLAGGGDAIPMESVAQLTERAIGQAAFLEEVGGGKPPDAAKIREYYAGFDKYERHGAKAGDGTLARADLPALFKDERERADNVQ